MDEADLADLRRAKLLLENPSLGIKIASAVGRPLDRGLALLPRRARNLVAAAATKAMEAALGVALWTLDAGSKARPKNWLHRFTVIATGGASGACGFAALPFELPIATTVMLRSIAEHARSQGEDLSRPEGGMNCLLVFALGGTTRADHALEAGYFAVRAALARTLAEAADYVAERVAADVVADKTAPALARLVTSIATRFTPAVADKMAAQLVPVIGAAGGAAINLLFIEHFQQMAWGHFTIRRLERKYGAQRVREAY